MRGTRTQEHVPVISVLMGRWAVEAGEFLVRSSASWPSVEGGEEAGETLSYTWWKVRTYGEADT